MSCNPALNSSSRCLLIASLIDLAPRLPPTAKTVFLFSSNPKNLMDTKDLRLAVLIDADNVPYSNIQGMLEEITKAQLLALHAGRLKDQGKLEPAHVSMLKRNNAAMALDSARLSRDLLGANGITDEYPIMRHLCNLETVKTYEGTDHIHALVIGERVTGVAAYR
jgi:hypothetical protein